ncbi:hypothetical protein [Sphingobium bisphenolivorans]|uniref:hypothetical protein n=1 Tax=Sphingobium bisphenolivorans TaxID=1335760 RepID=UPI00039FF476|nr:hypothetical protein [Sphingobium bisphenolivorans]
MMKTRMIAAMLLIGTAGSAFAQTGPTPPAEQAPAGSGGSEKVNLVIVYGDDPCPQSQGSDIVVCARKGEEERYRIPEPLRGDPNKPSNQAWGERVRSMEYVGRSGTESCSATGAGGFTGCFAQLARLAKAERQAADNASWKDLVEAERGRRLSNIDAESQAIEAQAVAQEKAEAARQQQSQQQPATTTAAPAP